ncbi:hypothetical protein DB313_04660 (plasmid) [Borrelia turcica IST7]|uniref:Uncharacterized protein n=1 Tax=Borrelia turcica IST7 TaxID=1104446 RepID=A0A386PP35_9SPIR|nr:hypothetical protein [Borrelia turcica]AYE36793.1 hypothetical protein DB313_04660 [Borrelia turcica IST7]
MIEFSGRNSSYESITIHTDKVKSPIKVKDIYFSAEQEKKPVPYGIGNPAVAGKFSGYARGKLKTYFSIELRLDDWMKLEQAHVDSFGSVSPIELWVTCKERGLSEKQYMLDVYIDGYTGSNMSYINVRGRLGREPKCFVGGNEVKDYPFV